MWQEPLLLVIGFALFFAASMAYMRLELSISSSKNDSSSLRSRRGGAIGDAINSLLTIQRRLTPLYDRKNTQVCHCAVCRHAHVLMPPHTEHDMI
jgi:hypothetical protein